MPQSKKEGIFLSLIMSLIMIYVMAALNNCVKDGCFTSTSWLIALQRLPLGFIVGIICDMAICTPLSRKLVMNVTDNEDKEHFKVLIPRFSMVVLMTIAMTVFSVVITWVDAGTAVREFFKYLPYNFTIALPIQMIIVAPISAVWARKLSEVFSSNSENLDDNAIEM